MWILIKILLQVAKIYQIAGERLNYLSENPLTMHVKFNQVIRFMKVALLCLPILFATVLASCSENDTDSNASSDTTTTIDPSTIDVSKIYIPEDLKSNNFYKSSSTWYYGRSRQSDHFIVFWAAGYGKNVPSSPEVPDAYRVDIDDLLDKAESFYEVNINELKFAEVGVGKSKLDQYKMMIFLFYQEDWMATGSGYDNTIGALWVSPSTCKPVGSVIAHEIGHSFQYQVFCDLANGTGFRYGFGGNGGNGFWEQTAQWQSFQSYPEQAFGHDFSEYTANCHRHICHESYRYASYFIHYYWANKHGKDFIGKLWRKAKEPEDPMQAYMRITGANVEQLNAEIYEAASRFVTWDLDALRTNGAAHIGQQSFKYTTLDDGSYQVAYDRCPGTTGYNVIRLNVPAAGTVVSTKFTGIVNAEGFNQVADPARANWRYGYVALLKDGTRRYSEMNSGGSTTATYTVPENCSKLWLVVTGAPNTYTAHPWDDNNSNDDQWPYKLKFTNTEIFGNLVFDGSEIPKDVDFNFDVTFPADATGYSGKKIELGDDVITLAKAFVRQPGQISSAMGDKIKLYAIENNGNLNSNMTAINGHWYNSTGNVCPWGNDAKVFSEYDGTAFVFSLGQYPNHCKAGDEFTIRQALVYEYETGKSVKATFTFKIKIQ